MKIHEIEPYLIGPAEFTKVAIIGSRTYENSRKIRQTVINLRSKFGPNLEIISGGAKDGADKYARKFALEAGVRYREFNPAYTIHSIYSVLPPEYFEQPYHVTQLYQRNTMIVRYCDYIMAFRSNGVSNGTDQVIRECKRFNKPFVIITEND